MLSPRTGGENLWMWVSDGMKGFILGLIGLSSGFTVASALFALIATIGVLNRLAQVTRSAKNIRWYEICYMAGGIIGNGVYLYQMPLPAAVFWERGWAACLSVSIRDALSARWRRLSISFRSFFTGYACARG